MAENRLGFSAHRRGTSTSTSPAPSFSAVMAMPQGRARCTGVVSDLHRAAGCAGSGEQVPEFDWVVGRIRLYVNLSGQRDVLVALRQELELLVFATVPGPLHDGGAIVEGRPGDIELGLGETFAGVLFGEFDPLPGVALDRGADFPPLESHGARCGANSRAGRSQLRQPRAPGMAARARPDRPIPLRNRKSPRPRCVPLAAPGRDHRVIARRARTFECRQIRARRAGRCRMWRAGRL